MHLSMPVLPWLCSPKALAALVPCPAQFPLAGERGGVRSDFPATSRATCSLAFAEGCQGEWLQARELSFTHSSDIVIIFPPTQDFLHFL